MRIGIVSNFEARGLRLDTDILREALEFHGHKVLTCNDVADYLRYAGGVVPAVLVHCERISWPNIEIPTRHWLLANPEFITEQDRRWIDRYIERILCKTLVAYDLCVGLFPGKDVYFLAFRSRDRFVEGSLKQERFLHVCGNSRVKGTEAVVGAWRWTRNDGARMRWPLTVVSDWYPDDNLPEGVTVLRNVSDSELAVLQNSCAVHLQPSETEGFGHALWEALSTGNPVITTKARPMSDIVYAERIDPCSEYKINYVTAYKVSALDVFHAARNAEYIRPTENNRKWFQEQSNTFSVTVDKCFDGKPAAPAVKTKGDLRIGFIGNFPETSTETHIKWALERLGHTVFPLQEQYFGPAAAAELRKIDALLWVKTPGLMAHNPEFVLDFAKEKKIRTISLHLDRFWDIPDREAEIGRHPFWRTDVVFSADGSKKNEARFRERGVNHFWLRPAVSEVYMHPGTPKDPWKVDVIFVGSQDYHPCYPFRKKLVLGLTDYFKDQFLVVGNVRGHALSDVYASAKVIVGDCIFAGQTDHYWSDRVAETFGRQGFMVHPEIEGFDYPCIRYKGEDLDSLIFEIERSLANTPSIRQKIARNCFDHCKEHDTWTQRMAEILE